MQEMLHFRFTPQAYADAFFGSTALQAVIFH